MAIPIKLQVFEGPMDLLMHLIEKNKIDIYDIPIVEITDQYLAYIRQMDKEDMNVTSEFLVMAATLLDIKSRMLLPREEEEEEEEDPRDELVRRLLEYKMYKYMSEELRDRSEKAGKSFYRPQDLPGEVRNYVPPVDYEELIGDATVGKLESIFKDVLKRRKSRMDPIRSGFGEIRKEEVNSAEKELYIRAFIKEHGKVDFRELLEHQESRQEVIVTFLLLLEMMKTQEIHVIQDEIGGKILIEDAPQQAEGEEPAEKELRAEFEPAAEAEQEAEDKPAESENSPVDAHLLIDSMKVLVKRVPLSLPADEPEDEVPEEDGTDADDYISVVDPDSSIEEEDPAERITTFYYNVDHLFARYDKKLTAAAKRIRSGPGIYRLFRRKRIWRRRRRR